jgi:hypothetical protein
VDSLIDQLAKVSGSILALVGLLTLVQGVREYVLQGKQKRADNFMAMRVKMKSNSSFQHIFHLADTNDSELANVAFESKRDVLGFFQELALMLNSGLINETIVHYMFGYYAIRIYESDNFQQGVDRSLNLKESPYWSLFRDFAERMQKIESPFREALRREEAGISGSPFERRRFRF